jgi:hypothetical protein
VEEVSESNIQDEEVIFKSLGYSIFSNLKEKNMVFEGWRDKKLFDTAIARVPGEFEDVKQLKNLGRCFAQGVKQIKNIMPLFEAGDRKCLILSDSDSMAREHQRDHQQSRGYGIWKRYDEILGSCAAVTGEDFIKETVFKDGLDETAQKFGISQLPVANLNKAGGKIKALREWLQANHVTQVDADRAIQEIKEKIFDGLKSSEIKSEYYDYLRAILPLVSDL